MPLPDDLVMVRIGSSNFVGSDGAALTGKTLRVTPTKLRLADDTADAIVYSEPSTATVDSGGAAWVDVPATDNPTLDSTFYYSISEPDGKSKYVIEAPSTSQVNLTTGLPTVYLSNAEHVDLPYDGIARIVEGPAGLNLIVQHRAPLSADGVDGQGFVDTLNLKIYGPKTAGAWGTGTSFSGSGVGADGADGLGVSSVDILGGHLIVTFTDTTTHDAGVVKQIDSLAFNTATPPHLIATYSDATTDDLGDLDLPTGGGGSGGAPTDLTPKGSTQSASPANVKDRPNPLANAIMDGTSHPLSERWPGNLTAAQLVFPGAAALTDEIDYWAIQTCLNNNDVVDLSYGTAMLHKSLLTAAGGGQTIYGHGRRATQLFLKSGSNSNVISPADQTNANPDVELRDFSVNGNKAGNTGTIGQTDGILLVRCDRLVVDNVEVYNVNGRGIHHHGLTGSTVNVQHWSHVYVHDNLHWGLHNSNGVRQVDYQAVHAIANGLRTDISLTQTGNGADNFTGGMLLDHSEVTGDGIQCHLNGQDGLWIRNAFACNLSNVWATRNGRHGIRVLGLVDSIEDNWSAQSNGTNNTLTGHDIWFDGTSTLNYGVTARTVFHLEAGPNRGASVATQGSWSGNEDYAVYFDDNMTTSDAEVHAKLYAGTVGTVRLPTAGLGSMFYSDGPTALEKVNSVTSAGTAQTIPDVNVATLNRYVLTAASCAFTLPPAGAGKSLTLSCIQDATGGRGFTFLPGGGIIKWAGGTAPTPTAGAGQVDVFAFLCIDGVHWLAFVMGQGL